LAREIVQNSLDLGRRRVREVMRPRREIVALDIRRPIAECLRLADETRYSRFPLSDGGDLDRLVGVVHVKDIYLRRAAGGLASDLQASSKPVIFVPETARLDRLLQLFLDRRLHLAVVVDEYGSTTGMVTLENVLEELVGQIQDEFDQEKPRIEVLGEGQWRLDGSLPLFELLELVQEPMEPSEVHTVGGWMSEQLGGFSKIGDSVALGRHRLTVCELDGMRASRVLLVRTETPSTQGH
jgi:CBS domain containing-hemolysin-like protein